MVMQDGNSLPGRVAELGRKLAKMVLPSAGELRRATGLSPDQYKDVIKYLICERLAHSAEFGALVRGINRYWMNQEGLDGLGASEEERSWHGPAGVAMLVQYDMPKVEAVYAVAERYITKGRTISAIHFAEWEPMCAVAELTYPGQSYPANVVVCWAFTRDTESEHFRRLEAIPEAMLRGHCRCISERWRNGPAFSSVRPMLAMRAWPSPGSPPLPRAGGESLMVSAAVPLPVGEDAPEVVAGQQPCGVDSVGSEYQPATGGLGTSCRDRRNEPLSELIAVNGATPDPSTEVTFILWHLRGCQHRHRCRSACCHSRR